MTNKGEVNPAHIKAHWDLKAVEIFFSLLKSHDTITADDFVSECRKIEMPPTHISRTCGGLFKSMKANGFIAYTKPKQFNLSERSSKPIPIWIVNKAALQK